MNAKILGAGNRNSVITLANVLQAVKAAAISSATSSPSCT